MEGCVEVRGGVHGGMRMGVWRYAEVHVGTWRGARRYAEGCMEVPGGVCGGVRGGMRRYMEGCAEVHRGVHGGTQRYM